jgi:signal transduction histidine kinase
MASTSRGGGRRRHRLRTGFLLVILLGAILPLTAVGVWLATSTQRSAEALVRSRVERSLAIIVQSVGSTWGTHRSALLHLVETEAIHAALRSGTPLHIGDTGGEGRHDPGMAATARWWSNLEGVVQRAVLRDTAGTVVGLLERPAPAHRGPEPALLAALVPVPVPVQVVASGERIGTLEAWVRAGALLPGEGLVTGVTGSLLMLFDPTDGSALLPLALDPALFAQPRFRWGDETWAVAHHQLFEPPLILALAGPVGDFAGPFEDAARRGLLALLVVMLATALLTGLVSRRLTRPLDALAAAAADVAGGHLDRGVPEDGPDEVHRLSRAFNEMTESLRGTLQRLSQREAVAAVGELAASLAHEVRNPLTAIRLNLERASEALPSGEAPAKWVRRALRDVERLDTSVGEVLHLARSGKVELAPVAVSVPLRAAMATATPRFVGRGAVLAPPEGADRNAVVMADAAALEQLFLNLLLNAADALPPGGRAGVRVEADRASVRVAVWDQGAGMTPEVLQRVLEPFFSTKPGGTGLGLAIAERVALAHGGGLDVDSEPGRGTTFTVTLRRADPTTPAARRPRARAHAGATVSSGHET